jgi:hypothetical protein
MKEKYSTGIPPSSSWHCRERRRCGFYINEERNMKEGVY